MRRWIIATTAAAGIALSSCSGPAAGAPTPEAWTPPPTATTVAPTEAAAPTEAPAATAVAQNTYTVQRGTVEQMLQLSGQVVSAQEKGLWFGQDGVVGTVYVKPEEAVTKGQLLVDLSLGDLAEQLSAAEAAVAKDQAALDNAAASQKLPVQRAEIDLAAARAALVAAQAPATAAEVTTARAHLAQAEAELEKTRNDASAVKNRAGQELRSAQRALAEAQAEFGAATSAHDRDKDNPLTQERLAKANAALRNAEDAVAAAQIEYDTAVGNEVALVKGAQAGVDIAKAALDTLLAGPDRAKVAAAQRDVRLAELALEDARQRVADDPDLKERLDASKKALAAVQAQIEGNRLYAPFDGQVSSVTAVAGAAVRSGAPVITLMDPSVQSAALQLVVPATGTAAGMVKAGQPVAISFDRYPGKAYTGAVSEAPGATANTGYLISYEPQDLTLEAGDKAVITVTVDRRENTLWLPAAAVRYDSDYFVMLLRDGVEVRVNVQIGLKTDERVEIAGGLNEGDVVSGA